MKQFLNGVIALLLVLITSCCADLPDVVNPGGSPVTTHRSLSVKEVSNRLNGIWGTLPKSNPSTRNSDVLPADSIFALPGGEFVGTYNPTVDDLYYDPNVEYIDTVNTYALVFDFKDDQGFIIMSAKDGLPDMLYYAEQGSFDPNDLKFSSTAGGFGVFMDLMDEIDTRASVSDDTEEECDCDPLCGGTSSLTFYRKNHMIINIRP